MLNLLRVLKCIKRGDLYQVHGYYALLHGRCHLILTDAFLVQKDLTKGTDTFLTPLPTLPARCSFGPLTLPHMCLILVSLQTCGRYEKKRIQYRSHLHDVQ